MPDHRATPNRRAAAAASPPPNPLAGVFQQAAIGMAIVTPDWRIVDLNPAFAHMVGYERDELISLGPAAIEHPEYRGVDAP